MELAIPSTVVIIPTRNRADLAVNAIQSVLREPVEAVHLIVSDNSTSEAARSALAAFCEQLSDPRVLYIKPPEALPMTQHWDWAMSQALQHSEAKHFIYLTDRSLFKPGELAKIVKLAQSHPDKVISYDWVTIFDQFSPIIVERQPQTGQMVEVSASRLLFLSSRSIFPRCLPRLMNSCVPRSVIEGINARFGNVFASISPDYNFCYRCLELVDSILYYDRAAYVSYAIPRSNGVGAIGVAADAYTDFIADLKLAGRRRSFATPVPAFETILNYMMHEYCVVQKATGSSKFPDVRLLQYLVRNIGALLINLAYELPLSALRFLVSLRTRARKIVNLQMPRIAEHERYPGFDSVGDAINYAISIHPNGAASAPHLNLLSGNARS